MTTESLLRKARIIQRLLDEVDLYWQEFEKPLPLKIASAKYGKALEKLGGFHETVRELENDGSLVFERHVTGRTVLYPNSIKYHELRA